MSVHRQKLNGFLTVDVQPEPHGLTLTVKVPLERSLGHRTHRVLYLQKGFKQLTFLLVMPDHGSAWKPAYMPCLAKSRGRWCCQRYSLTLLAYT